MNQLLLKNKLKNEFPTLDWGFPQELRPNFEAYAGTDLYEDGEYHATIQILYNKGDDSINTYTHDDNNRTLVRVSKGSPNIAKAVVTALESRPVSDHLTKFIKIWRSLV